MHYTTQDILNDISLDIYAQERLLKQLWIDTQRHKISAADSLIQRTNINRHLANLNAEYAMFKERA